MNKDNPEEESPKGEPITFGSTIALSLLQNSSLYIYSEGFLIPKLVIKSFDEKSTIMQSDFNYCNFKILPFSTHSNFKTQTAFLNDLIYNINDFTEKSKKTFQKI